jgi:lipoyl synthase
LKPEAKPDWVRMPGMGRGQAGEVRRILRSKGLSTVCLEARCPNRGHCYQRGTATFLILGSVCTRNCAYCAIEKNQPSPLPPDPSEPERVAAASAEMGLRYVVVTSVTRDDLPDGGASHFAETVKQLKAAIQGVRVEVLTPDFAGSRKSLETVAESGPAVLNHNLETVERLFPVLRPVASYRQSLKVLEEYRSIAPLIPLKSGIMTGLGETGDDIEKTLRHMRHAGVTMLTMGQYLQPTPAHVPVARYMLPTEFHMWRERAMEMGFAAVAAGPLVRSSYHADLLGDENG